MLVIVPTKHGLMQTSIQKIFDFALDVIGDVEHWKK